MSAVVSTMGFSWFCADCVAGEDGFDLASDAHAAARQHDELNEHGAA